MLPFHEQLRHWADEPMRGFDSLGCDEIGDAVVTIPTAGANYTDAKTVAAVQAALASGKYGKYDLGDSGPNGNGVDGVFGRKTKLAIEKMQTNAGLRVTGTINEDVIMALKVTPGVLPPGVTMAGRAAVQAQVALDAATKIEHAATPLELQQATEEAAAVAAAAQPPLPPDVLQAARDAVTKSKAATTPAQVQEAKQQAQAAAVTVAAKVAPSWWVQPAWPGGLKRWQIALIGGGGAAGLAALFAWLVSSGAGATAAAAVGIGTAAKASK